MAQSFTSEQNCSVSTFETAISNGADVRTQWGLFCDCMYLRSQENVTDIGGGAKSFSTELVRTGDWYNCQKGFCADPFGCDNPRTGRKDPFDIGVGIAFAPWTDLGASGRQIPKRGAGVFYVLGEVFSIRPDDYLPLEMWKQYFRNGALYTLRVSKLALFPIVGIPLASAMLAFPANVAPLAGLAAIQLVAERKDFVEYMLKPAAEGSLGLAVMVMKAVPNAIAGSVFTCIGVILQKYCKDQIDTGEINRIGGSDPDANVQFIRSIIRFLASSAEDLGTELDKSIKDGLNIDAAPGVINIISRGLQAIVNSPPQGMTPQAVQVLKITSDSLYCVYIFTDELSNARGASARQTESDAVSNAANRIVKYLFGIDLASLRTAINKDAQAVKTTFANATNKKVTSFADGIKLIDAISAAINAFVKVIHDIDQAIGGGVLQLSQKFAELSATFAPTANQLKVMSAQADTMQKSHDATAIGTISTTKANGLAVSSNTSTRDAGNTGGGTSQPTFTVVGLQPAIYTPPRQAFTPVVMSIPPTITVVPTIITPRPPGISPVRPNIDVTRFTTLPAGGKTNPIGQGQPVPAKATGAGLAVGGATIGFVAGGPVGAALGGLVGLLLGKK